MSDRTPGGENMSWRVAFVPLLLVAPVYAADALDVFPQALRPLRDATQPAMAIAVGALVVQAFHSACMGRSPRAMLWVGVACGALAVSLFWPWRWVEHPVAAYSFAAGWGVMALCAAVVAGVCLRCGQWPGPANRPPPPEQGRPQER